MQHLYRGKWFNPATRKRERKDFYVYTRDTMPDGFKHRTFDSDYRKVVIDEYVETYDGYIVQVYKIYKNRNQIALQTRWGTIYINKNTGKKTKLTIKDFTLTHAANINTWFNSKRGLNVNQRMFVQYFFQYFYINRMSEDDAFLRAMRSAYPSRITTFDPLILAQKYIIYTENVRTEIFWIFNKLNGENMKKELEELIKASIKGLNEKANAGELNKEDYKYITALSANIGNKQVGAGSQSAGLQAHVTV